MYFNKLIVVVCAASCLLGYLPSPVVAADKPVKPFASKTRTFSEEEFLRLFSHKSRKQVSDALGRPLRIGQSSKPSNVENTIGRPLKTDKNVHVEMWYYENLVRYDPRHTYKTVELTFVNDRCMNITYFNTK
jgi:outer membrane protein assembly factor BamE (lipoprotein component of BamABCDE complex)